MSAAGGATSPSSDEYGPRAGLLVPLPSAERGVAVVTSASPDGRFFLYVNGTNVIVRDLADPSKACVYAEHAHPVKVAKFSPSGKYVASGGAFADAATPFVLDPLLLPSLLVCDALPAHHPARTFPRTLAPPPQLRRPLALRHVG
jgi:hypothetical protein